MKIKALQIVSVINDNYGTYIILLLKCLLNV